MYIIKHCNNVIMYIIMYIIFLLSLKKKKFVWTDNVFLCCRGAEGKSLCVAQKCRRVCRFAGLPGLICQTGHGSPAALLPLTHSGVEEPVGLVLHTVGRAVLGGSNTWCKCDKWKILEFKGLSDLPKLSM